MRSLLCLISFDHVPQERRPTPASAPGGRRLQLVFRGFEVAQSLAIDDGLAAPAWTAADTQAVSAALGMAASDVSMGQPIVQSLTVAMTITEEGDAQVSLDSLTCLLAYTHLPVGFKHHRGRRRVGRLPPMPCAPHAVPAPLAVPF